MNIRKALLYLSLILLPLTVAPAAHVSAATPPGPFVTFLFSRAEVGAAQNCQPNNPGSNVLTGVVAPLMQSEGITTTTTVNTLATSDTEGCTHGGESLTSSWGDLNTLSGYGWSFVPHEYDSPKKVASLTAAQDWAVTCGQAQTLQSHALNGSTGMIAYPGTQQGSSAILALQQNYGQNCFGWGRRYSQTRKGVTTTADLVSPYWAYTLALKGGPGTGSPAYTDPSSVIAAMQALQPGQWLTVQMYLLVSGTSPPGDSITWNCDGTAHTSSDVERYCLNDAEQVFAAAAQMQSAGQLTVTDPGTVATAWGRTVTGMTRP